MGVPVYKGVIHPCIKRNLFLEDEYWLILRQRYRIFFLHGKVRFLAFLRNIEWMNEKAVFFFPGLCFFFRPRNWMNEWHVNFSRKKKNTKKTQILKKKKSNLRPKKKSYFQGLLQRRARKLLSKPIYRFFIYIPTKSTLFFFSSSVFW